MARHPLSLLLALLASVFTIAYGFRVPPTPNIVQRDENLPARVPYVFPPPGTDPIADAIRARRVNGTLLALDGALLNSPLVAQGWNQFFTVIRENLTIPADMRELFILRTAALNNAAYQWGQHESVGRSEGLTTDQLLVIRLASQSALTHHDKKVLGDSLAAALQFADAITESVYVPRDVYDNLAKHLSDQQMVEAVATAGSYNFVSRFTVSLNVDGRMHEEVPIPQ
ncbi:4-carboxymuconolactone decarboxylase [Mycena sp. CBHHK59/15]|nr:4-carboxymuconolactone decarboxylase [Mycena sp. CBHHK59/15]